MVVNTLRSGSPGVRLGLALLASLFLHTTLLFAPGLRPPKKPPEPRLTVRLPLPALEPVTAMATQPEEKAEPAPGEILAPASPVPAVPPAPTLVRKSAPKPLAGRALNQALAALSREEFYPREAIARGLEGKVVLLLTLAENGAVTGVEVASSSGHALLDEAALKAAARIGTLTGGRRQVLLPVDFRLD